MKMIMRMLLLIPGILVFASMLQAAEGEEQLIRFLKDLHTLRADFEQTLERTDEDGVYLSRGTFYLKRPGQLRWEYAPPNQQLIVADGDRIWLHDIELEQVSHRGQKAALEGTPAQLLSDTAPLVQHFAVQDLGREAGLYWVELVPLNQDAQFTHVRLALLDDQLQRMEMLDNFGQITRFVFSNMQRNPALRDSLFVFNPPSGIDLIGDL